MDNLKLDTWENGLLKDWTSYSTGGDPLTVTEETVIKLSGSSAKITSAYAVTGMQQACPPYVNVRFNAYPVEGNAALHFAKENGQSCAFSDPVVVQEHFQLYDGTTSTAVRNVLGLRIENGDLIELFSGGVNSEFDVAGQLYMKRNGGEPTLFMNIPAVRLWTWGKVIDFGTHYTWVYMRVYFPGGLLKGEIWAVDINRDFTVQTNDRLLLAGEFDDYALYNLLVLPSGRIVMPFYRCELGENMPGPWFVDIMYSDDNLQTVQILGQERNAGLRGSMEPHPVLLSTGIVAILLRTQHGTIYRCDYDPVANTLSEPVTTGIQQSETSSYAINLANGDILYCWVAGAFRDVINMAVSSDDMLTWHSYHVIQATIPEGYTYIHQPNLFEDPLTGKIVIYWEAVANMSSIISFKTESDLYRLDNVSKVKSQWNNISGISPHNTAYVQLLNVIQAGSVYWDEGSLKNEAQEIFVYSNGNIITLPLLPASDEDVHIPIVYKRNAKQKLTLVDMLDTYASNVFAFINNRMWAIKKTEITMSSAVSFIANENQKFVGYIQPDPSDCVMSISGGPDAAKFTIEPMTGKLTFVDYPDYEIPADADADNVYNLTVRFTKNGLFADFPITVTVANIVDEVGAILYSSRTYTWLDSQDASMITKDVNNFVSIWFDKVYGKTTLGPELATGYAYIGNVYKIITCDADYFYVGCQPGDIYVAATQKALSQNNKVQLVYGTHFTQPTLAKQPLFNTTGILFDGIDDFLKGQSTIQLKHPCSIYIVFKQVGWTVNDVILESSSVSGIELKQSSISPQLMMLDNTSYKVIEGITIGAYHFLRLIYNETQSEYKIDNNAAEIVSIVKSGNGSTAFILGSRYNYTAAFSNIEVAELIMRHNVDTDIEKQILTNYLLAKYGL